MKHTKIIILAIFLIVNVAVVKAIRHYHNQKKQEAAIMIRDATRYSGVSGPTITAFDERTNRWIAELRAESVEETLIKLTGASEYVAGLALTSRIEFDPENEEGREGLYYGPVIDVLLSNRRFRKAYEDVQRMDKHKAAELIIKHINENLIALRIMLQEDRDKIARGEHKGIILTRLSQDVEGGYRPMSRFDVPPTRTGRKYAVLSYLLLASFFELQDVRQSIEDVVQFAKEEYECFNSMDFDDSTFSFKSSVLRQSLYNPSLLLTATLCDPSWNKEKHEKLKAKFIVNREVVDYQARAIEQDKDARDGLLPVVKHDKMLKIRYYKGITDEEFNAFFAE